MWVKKRNPQTCEDGEVLDEMVELGKVGAGAVNGECVQAR